MSHYSAPVRSPILQTKLISAMCELWCKSVEIWYMWQLIISVTDNVEWNVVEEFLFFINLNIIWYLPTISSFCKHFDSLKLFFWFPCELLNLTCPLKYNFLGLINFESNLIELNLFFSANNYLNIICSKTDLKFST